MQDSVPLALDGVLRSRSALRALLLCQCVAAITKRSNSRLSAPDTRSARAVVRGVMALGLVAKDSPINIAGPVPASIGSTVASLTVK